jgi:hypothetical protein
VSDVSELGHSSDSSETPSGGSAAVDRALERLTELDERPLSEHADVFDAVHRELQDALSQAAADGAEG